ncbi:MAG: hypothetical protein WC565_08425 [Parcubacteria group bacterium]
MKAEGAFLTALAESAASVNLCAAWLARHGYQTRIVPTVVRPDSSVRMQYGDGGDIEITKRVEVKQRSLPFTSASDYPYPTVLVDEVYKVDRLGMTGLDGYMIVNSDGTVACVVKKATRPHWSVESRWDSSQSRQCEFYACPVGLCEFVSLSE